MKIEINNKNITELAKWIEESVEWLKSQDSGCCTYKLDDRLAVCVGWSDGFDTGDPTVIHSEKGPSWAIVVGLKVWTSDDMRTDFDWINSPYYEDGCFDVVYTDQSICPDEDYEYLAKYYLVEFNKMNNLVIERNGSVTGCVD